MASIKRKIERQKRKLAKGEQLTNVIDEYIEVPEEQAHLIADGKLHFLLNRHVMELVTEITDELLRSRNIPPNPGSISIADPVAVYVLTTEPELEELDALEKAIHWYKTQADRCRQDAMIVAITDTNDINLTAQVYKPGEVAFENQSTDGRKIPKWRQAVPSIPAPERNLVNAYENRLKVIYDFLNACGVLFTSTFWRVFNQAMGESIRLLHQQDEDGFHKNGTRKPLSVGSSAADEAAGDATPQQ